jgi:hypothetical protein
MKLRKLLEKLRLRSLEGEGRQPGSNVDGMTTMTHSATDQGGNIPVSAPPNWVPSQQDERPH